MAAARAMIPQAIPFPQFPSTWKRIRSVTIDRIGSAELVFTELILQILYWIYEIAIHSPIFILNLPTKFNVSTSILLIFGGKLGCF
jgi:hypothetical protein